MLLILVIPNAMNEKRFTKVRGTVRLGFLVKFDVKSTTPAVIG